MALIVLTTTMSDPIFDPTDDEKVIIHEIEQWEKRWAKIHEMTQKIEDKHRENAQEEMHQGLDDEKIL